MTAEQASNRHGQPDVTIIVVSHGHEALLPRCIALSVRARCQCSGG